MKLGTFVKMAVVVFLITILEVAMMRITVSLRLPFKVLFLPKGDWL